MGSGGGQGIARSKPKRWHQWWAEGKRTKVEHLEDGADVYFQAVLSYAETGRKSALGRPSQ